MAPPVEHPAAPGRPGRLRQWWLDRSVRAKGMIVVAVPLIALVGISSASLVLHNQERQERQVAHAATALSNSTKQVLADAVNAETGVRGYVATGDPLFLQPYNLTLTRFGDNRLPDSTGEQVLGQLAAEPATAAIPVVILSGDTAPATVDGLLAAGAAGFVPKPFDLHQLMSAIDKHLRLDQRGGSTTGRTGEQMGVPQTATEGRDEAELRSLLAAIVESSSDAIIGKNLDGIITTWNAAAKDLYGYTAEEMIGRSVAKIFPPDRADELGPILDRLRLGERVEHFETTRVRKDGTVVEVSISVSPVYDHTGTVTGAATVARDITKRRSAEARMHQADRMDTVGQLASGIAHDFNNLLGAIIGFATLAAEDAADRPGLRADIEQIISSAQRAARLTRELLIFSQRDTEQLELVSPNAVITGVCTLLEASVGRHIALRLDLDADVPTVLADRGRFEQLLLNLSLNAHDAMPDGGTLTISSRAAGLDAAAAHALAPQPSAERFAQVTVSDTGRGMSPEVRRHIFEPFFTTKGPATGTGLGLATVYGIVSQAGGAIGVDSAPGAGSAFHVYLPAAATAAPVAPAAAAPAAAQGHGEKIVIVDDEPSVLQAASRILCRNGYTTLEAASGAEALRLISDSDCALLLTDTVMPGMSGFVLAERAARLRPGLRVLHMSGNTGPDPGDSKKVFLQKPFTAEALLGKVRGLLEAGGAGADRSPVRA